MTKKFIIRAKLCNTGLAMLLICLFLCVIVVYKPQYLPCLIFALFIMTITFVQAFYFVEVES
ncbi:MAG: hypothetical protein QXP06_07925 [Candidatus Bathyarchaeia archaeon]